MVVEIPKRTDENDPDGLYNELNFVEFVPYGWLSACAATWTNAGYPRDSVVNWCNANSQNKGAVRGFAYNTNNWAFTFYRTSDCNNEDGTIKEDLDAWLFAHFPWGYEC